MSLSIFLSTPSARRATTGLHIVRLAGIISIHALREEGDATPAPWTACGIYFYPRPPRGGRPRPLDNDNGLTNISIHALREEGDLNNLLLGDIEVISIHALREEGDRPAQS